MNTASSLSDPHSSTATSACQRVNQRLTATIDDQLTLRLDERWLGLMRVLHRGGAFAYYWQQRYGSTWFASGFPQALPADADVYFGIHPCSSIPTTNAKGEGCRPSQVRGQLAFIAALNCLYAEFDAKDYNNDKAALLAFIVQLALLPSVIIDSGGGYHCYWLFVEPLLLTNDAERQRARELQIRWVDFVAGDKAANDLTRVLRVPGTVNRKYSPPRPVTIVQYDLNLVYTVAELEASLPPIPTQKPIAAATCSTHPQQHLSGDGSDRVSAREVIAKFNAEHPIDSLLSYYGAVKIRDGWACNCGVAHSNDTQLLVTAQGRAIFFSPRCRWAPSRTDRNNRPVADSFDLYTQVEHGGDKTRALKALNPIEPKLKTQLTEGERHHSSPATIAARALDAQRKRDARQAEALATLQDVHNRAATDPILKQRPSERAVLDALLLVAGTKDWCRPSKARLAEMTGCGLGTIKRALMRLEERCYFISTGQGGGPNNTALRTFLRGSPSRKGEPLELATFSSETLLRGSLSPASVSKADVSTGIMSPARGGRLYVDQMIHESIDKEDSEHTLCRAGEGAPSFLVSTPGEPQNLDEAEWAALLASEPFPVTKLDESNSAIAWGLVDGICETPLAACSPVLGVAGTSREQVTPPSPAPDRVLPTTQSQCYETSSDAVSTYDPMSHEQIRAWLQRAAAAEVPQPIKKSTSPAAPMLDQQSSVSEKPTVTSIGDTPVCSQLKRRRLRDSAPLSWHYAQLAAYYQLAAERQPDERVPVTPLPPEPQREKGPPRSPRLRQHYYALLGRAKKATSVKQRQWLRMQAASLEEWYAPGELEKLRQAQAARGTKASHLQPALSAVQHELIADLMPAPG